LLVILNICDHLQLPERFFETVQIRLTSFLTELNENPKKEVAKTICAVFGAVTIS
jgi:hypothetical protein